MTNRQKAALETKRRLLETGERMIAEQGFSNVSIDDIVKACGVARGTFYTYFKNKEDIVQAISRQPFGEIEVETREMDCGIQEKLCYYVKEFTKRVQQHGLKITQQWVKNVIDPDAVPEDKDGKKLDYDLEALRGILETGVDKGELSKTTPVQKITNLIISQLYGIMTCWCMSNGTFETESLLEDYCEIQLKTLLARYINKEELNDDDI